MFYANRFHDHRGKPFMPRYVGRLIVTGGEAPLPEGTGVLVKTVHPVDLGGAEQGAPFYARLYTSRGPFTAAFFQNDYVWASFAGLPPSIGLGPGAMPFWDFTVVRSKTVPGFSRSSESPPLQPQEPLRLHQGLLWSCSWNPWDGAPVDEAGRWEMSFCTTGSGPTACGSGQAQQVDITPGLLQ